MKYITHRRYKQTAMCMKDLNMRYGTEVVREDDGIIYTMDGNPICFDTSANAHIHFARNDDGMGLERGALTYAIAYAPRKGMKGYRFTEAERGMLGKEYSHWLRQDVDMILFNNDFFAAPVDELRELADKLNIKI